MAAMSTPNPKNSPMRVQSWVVKTLEAFTERYHSRSVQKDANITNPMTSTASTTRVVTSTRPRRAVGSAITMRPPGRFCPWDGSKVTRSPYVAPFAPVDGTLAP